MSSLQRLIKVLRNPGIIPFIVSHHDRASISEEWMRRRKETFHHYKGGPVSMRPGFKMILNPNDDFVSLPLFCDRVYEPGVSREFKRLLRSDSVVVDVGANIGYFTLLAASHSPGVQVHAFEPEPSNNLYFERNLALNELKNVRRYPFALSDRDSSSPLYLSKSNPGDHRLAPDDEENRESVIVETRTLDSVLREAHPSLDILKIDVQGHEGRVLEGMKSTVAESPNLSILMEFWPYGLERAGTSPRAFLQMLQSWGFEFREILDSGLLANTRKWSLGGERFDFDYYVNLLLTRGEGTTP